MKEIIEKLYENRQIELAKSILESNGYSYKLVPKSSKQVAKALKINTREWSPKWKDNFYDGRLSKLYHEKGTDPNSQEYVGVVFAPFKDGEDSFEYLAGILRDGADEDLSGTEFSTEAEAKKWVENWFRDNA